MEATVAVRIEKEKLDELRAISKEEKRKNSEVLREALDIGLKEKRLRIALAKYKNREISTGKAAEMAGVSISRFLDILREHNVPFNYSLRDLRKDVEGFA